MITPKPNTRYKILKDVTGQGFYDIRLKKGETYLTDKDSVFPQLGEFRRFEEDVLEKLVSGTDREPLTGMIGTSYRQIIPLDHFSEEEVKPIFGTRLLFTSPEYAVKLVLDFGEHGTAGIFNAWGVSDRIVKAILDHKLIEVHKAIDSVEAPKFGGRLVENPLSVDYFLSRGYNKETTYSSLNLHPGDFTETKIWLVKGDVSIRVVEHRGDVGFFYNGRFVSTVSDLIEIELNNKLF